jgi:hypothetical protein
MFSVLSTSCFLTHEHAPADHKQTVYQRVRAALDTFEKRFEYILAQCELDRARFARLLSGAGQQKITNWLDRGRIGAPSRREVFDLTGASPDWLNDGIGDPFPHGPQKLTFVREISPDYGATTKKVELNPREVALIENYRASSERFRRAVDEQIAASAESTVKHDAS